jgi:hypothetical protein
MVARAISCRWSSWSKNKATPDRAAVGTRAAATTTQSRLCSGFGKSLAFLPWKRRSDQMFETRWFQLSTRSAGARTGRRITSQRVPGQKCTGKLPSVARCRDDKVG